MSDPDKPSRYSGWGSGTSRWSGAGAPAAPAPAASLSPPEVQRLQVLYESAIAHLVRGDAEAARPALAELQRFLPGHEAVKQLAKHVAVVAFQWPAQRERIALAARAAPRQEDIDLVAFHVDMAATPSGMHMPTDYMAVLARSFESARLRAPGCPRILITDERTAVPASLGADAVIRYPIDPAFLMFERMRVQEIFLHDRAPGRSSVLMDSDVVVNADPASIFAQDFDVGLTWRPELKDAPFNGGMIFAAAGEGAHAFFVRALQCYRAIAADPAVAVAFPRDLRAWWGDQYAIALQVGYREYAERGGDALRVDGVRVGFFPCADYNFTIEGGDYPPEMLRRKFFIHFKGNRKAMQAQYLELMRAGKV